MKKLNVQVTLKNSERNREVVERLVAKNVETKLDTYLASYVGAESGEGRVDLTLEENKKWNFGAALRVTLDGNGFYYSREDYRNLDDLVNHLFDHLKEELSNRSSTLATHR